MTTLIKFIAGWATRSRRGRRSFERSLQDMEAACREWAEDADADTGAALLEMAERYGKENATTQVLHTHDRQ